MYLALGPSKLMIWLSFDKLAIEGFWLATINSIVANNDRESMIMMASFW